MLLWLVQASSSRVFSCLFFCTITRLLQHIYLGRIPFRCRNVSRQGFILEIYFLNSCLSRRNSSSAILLFGWRLMAASRSYSVFTSERALLVWWPKHQGVTAATRSVFLTNFDHQLVHRQISLTHWVFGTWENKLARGIQTKNGCIF